MNLSWIDAGIVLGYLAVVVSVGIYMEKRAGKNIEKKENVNIIPKKRNRYTLMTSTCSIKSFLRFRLHFFPASRFSSNSKSLFNEGNIISEVKAIEANPGFLGNIRIAINKPRTE